MTLGLRTVQKFIREALVTEMPMTVGKTGLSGLKQRLQSFLEKMDEMHFHWQERPNYPKETERYLCDISVRDPRYSHYWHGHGGIALLVDDQDALWVVHAGKRYPVGNEDELFELLRLCRERGVRLKGQHAKRGKVRSLRMAAIMAKVQQLAQAYQMDYAVHEGSLKLTVDLRFDKDNMVHVDISYARFHEQLERLEAALPVARDLALAGVCLSVHPRANKYALRRRKWVLYNTLA